MKFRIFVQAFCAAALLSVPSYAQEIWTRYHKTNQITDIAVHGDNIWCATTGGLVRWDRKTGAYQEIPEKDDSAYNIVTTIEAAPDGSIWGIVRGETYYKRDSRLFMKYHPPTYLVHYDGVSWSEYDKPWYEYGVPETDLFYYRKGISATALDVDSNGDVWAGASCNMQDIGDLVNAGRGFSHYKDGQWSHISIVPLPQSEFGDVTAGQNQLVVSIATGADGVVWVSTFGLGVFRYDGQSVQNTGGQYGWLCTGPDGTVWLAGAKSVQRYDGEAWTPVTVPGEFLSGDISITSLACDSGNVFWAGTTGGLLRYDGSAWKRYTTANGLAGNSVAALAVDDAGTLWIGTANGMSGYDGGSFRTYRVEDRLAGDRVRALAFEPNGTAWIGTSSGLTRYDGRNWRSYTMADGLPDSTITAITMPHPGDVWVGTAKGVAHFIGSGWKTYTTVNGLASNNILSMTSGKDGTVWVGTNRGVSHFDRRGWWTFTGTDGIPRGWFQSIVATSDGAVWATDTEAIFRYYEGKWEKKISGGNEYNYDEYNDIAGLASENGASALVAINSERGMHYPSFVRFRFDRIDGDSPGLAYAHYGEISGRFSCFAVSPDSTLWYASALTIGGMEAEILSYPRVYRSKPGAAYSISNGLSSSIVNTIAIAPDGAVWFGTESGLSRLEYRSDPSAVGGGTALPEAFAIRGNFPNPFNPSTTISFTLPAASQTELSVYSITGQKVRTLLSGRMEAGAHSALWDGRDDAGNAVSSGVYIARLRAGKTVSSQKMLLMK